MFAEYSHHTESETNKVWWLRSDTSAAYSIERPFQGIYCINLIIIAINHGLNVKEMVTDMINPIFRWPIFIVCYTKGLACN